MTNSENALSQMTNQSDEGRRPSRWSDWQKQLSTRLDKLRERAKATLSEDAYLYVAGSAGASQTERSNEKGLNAWKILPSMLQNGNTRFMEVELFGKTYSSPLLLAPVGVLGIFHAEGEIAVARAARSTGVPMIVSTAGTRTMEQVAQELDGSPGWFQLYWPLSENITASLLDRAKRAGYEVLVVTLDTSSIGWRPENLDSAYLPFMEGIGCANGFSDPVFGASVGLDPKEDLLATGDRDRIRHFAKAWSGEVNSGYFHTWEELAIIQRHWTGPIVLKGIQTVGDARKAIELGIHGIVVSNHGGRQVDGAISSISALDAITSDGMVARSNLTILFDSGIRNGTDMIRALALGADAVLVGRPYVYGLATDGSAGVEHVIRSLLGELECTMSLMGFNDVKQLSRSCLRQPPPGYDV